MTTCTLCAKQVHPSELRQALDGEWSAKICPTCDDKLEAARMINDAEKESGGRWQ